MVRITIPSSVKSLGYYTFNGCRRLSHVICECNNPPLANNTTFNTVPTDAILYVPVGTSDNYKNAEGWNCFTSIEEQDKTVLVDCLLDLNIETAMYYNLQGERVLNPENGIYIKSQGGKSTKVVM